MSNSKRKQILNYLRDTTLAAITTGNGYNTSPATILRGLREIDSLADSSFPALYVVAPNEDRHNITKNQIQCTIKVVIVGYVKGANGVDGVQAQLDDLIEDTTKALEQDRTLGGLAAKWLEIKSVKADEDDTRAFAAFAMPVDVVYVSEGVNP